MTTAKDPLFQNTYPNHTPDFFTFKNDYIFTEAMKDKKVLKGFLMCLTGIDIDSIKDITILPRHLDKDTVTQKLGILDCRLELNNNRMINIELQILCFPHWDSRSLYYICKMLTDQYHKGINSYARIKRCIHVCILDFNFTDASDDFYSIYKLRDENGQIYTDLIEMHVIQLKKREAPGVKEAYPKLYQWTQLFSIKSRKELENMTELDEYIQAAAQAMDDLNLDEAHREAAFYRFLHLMDEQTILEEKEELKAETEFWKTQKESLQADNASLEADNAALEADNAALEADNAALEAESKSLKDQLGNALSQLRTTLISVLEQKFGPLSEPLLDTIRQQTDFAQLNEWLSKAFHANSYESFIKCNPELKEEELKFK